MTTEYITLPAFKITRSDGTTFITSMAIGTTVKEVEHYFFGWKFTDEDAHGTEKNWTVVKVEEVQS